jgi:multiple sugar transport system substrate-binding protein
MGDAEMSEDRSKTQAGAIMTAPATDRRTFLARAGGLLGATALGLGAKKARAQDRVQISFASAHFPGKETFGNVIDSFNQSQGRVQVSFIDLPPASSSTEVYQGLVQQLARRSGTPDVFAQDVVWIAGFAAAGWALPLDQYFPAAKRSEYFGGLIKSCTFQEKLTALPWFVDSGMLYYRKDLLAEHGGKLPTTWAELADIAQAAHKANQVKFGYVWQGKQSEVLVCDAVEVIGSNNGSILSADGKTCTINDPKSVEAIQFLYDTINKSKISPADVLSWNEEPSRQPFTAGQSMFLRNWSYVYGIAQDPQASQVVDKVGVAPLPHFPGGPSVGCLGGYQLGINAATQQRDAAIEFLTWMSSPATQLRLALNFGLAPTRPAVYTQPKLVSDLPFMSSLQDVFTGATPRPITPKYAQVTLEVQSGISGALVSGNVQAEMDKAKKRIDGIVGS